MGGGVLSVDIVKMLKDSQWKYWGSQIILPAVTLICNINRALALEGGQLEMSCSENNLSASAIKFKDEVLQGAWNYRGQWGLQNMFVNIWISR